jgi:hypothetical protein
LLALIGGAKLGAGACYLFDMAVGDAPVIARPPASRGETEKSSRNPGTADSVSSEFSRHRQPDRRPASSAHINGAQRHRS